MEFRSTILAYISLVTVAFCLGEAEAQGGITVNALVALKHDPLKLASLADAVLDASNPSSEVLWTCRFGNQWAKYDRMF